MAELVNLLKIDSEKLGLYTNALKMKVMTVDWAKFLTSSTVLSEYKKVHAFVHAGSIIEQMEARRQKYSAELL